MRGATPTELLHAHAREFPSRAALEWRGHSLSYAELEAAVDRLAGFLADTAATAEADAGTAPRVAVRATQLPETAIALLAIARCGLVTVPLDPTAPPQRLGVLVREVGATLVLTDDRSAFDGAGLPAAAPCVAIQAAIDAGRPYGDPAAVGDDDVVSIIFTSGSTGRPKGVLSPRRLLVESMRRNRATGIAPGERRFGVPIAGTVGNFERVMLSAAIGDGATLVGYDVRTLGVQRLGDWLRTEQIQHFAIVPSVLRAFLETVSPGEFFPQLATVFTWGEPLAWDDVRRLRRLLRADATVLATYRSTEASGIACFAVGADTELSTGNVPAGPLMPGVEVTIVDDDGVGVPAGTTGHIVVSRGDLALGYWQRPDETAAVFSSDSSGARACRTGDLGSLDASGQLIVTGRADQMVKVAGNRVDLGEIETALRALPAVSDCAVVARTDEARDTRLSAYVAAAAELDVVAVRAALREVLPGHMVPDVITVVDELPRLPNGKVDRTALSARPAPATPPRRVAEDERPRDELEQALAQIWHEVLRVPVPRTARFSDLGGDSLRAARMFGKVEQQLGFDRPVSLLLQAPTVAELAVALRHTDVDVWSPLVAVREDGDGAPLFIVHGAGGDVMFAELVANGLTQPRRVYGLRPSVLSGRPLAEQTIEELASTYLAAMRTVQPTGPYALFGYSLGARIAYEIGRQARAAGDEISLLALGDAAAPGVDLESVLPPTATRWRRRIAEQRAAGASPLAVGATLGRRLLRRTSRRWLQRASTATAEQRIDAHLRRSETVPPALRNDFSVSQLSALSRRYTSPGPVDFPLLLIRTNQVPDVPDLGWSPLTPELLSEHVPCVHLDLVREPHVTRLAGILDRHLARSADHAVAHR